MHSTSVPTHEVRLYIGSRERYNGPKFTKKSLIKAIGKFQDSQGDDMCVVRVTPTTYVATSKYNEDGWEVAAINYPRRPKARTETTKFMKDLAVFLIERFKQNRISVVLPERTIMYQSEDAVATNR